MVYGANGVYLVVMTILGASWTLGTGVSKSHRSLSRLVYSLAQSIVKAENLPPILRPSIGKCNVIHTKLGHASCSYIKMHYDLILLNGDIDQIAI